MTEENRTDWSTKELKYLIECLASSESVAEGVKKFQAVYNRAYRSIRRKFEKEGLGNPKDYLGSYEPEEIKEHHEGIRQEIRQKLAEQAEKKQLTELRKKQAVIDYIIDAVREEVAQIPAPRNIPYAKAQKIKHSSSEEIVIPVSDVQIGEMVHSEDVGGLGEYSFDIFKIRVEMWKNFVIKMLQRRLQITHIDKIHIPFIGDIVEGMDIFPSQAFHIDMGVVKQTIQGAFVFSMAIAEIANAFSHIPIEIEHVGGNHGRNGRKGATPYKDNWDRVLGFVMQLHLKDYKNIRVMIPDAWFIVKKIKGWNFHFSHGDDIKSSLSIPAYGMLRSHSRETVMLNMPLHYYQIGHHHTMTMIQNGYGEVICNGNWVGANEFVSKQIKSGNRPSQLMYAVNAKYGICERYVIYFESQQNFQERLNVYLDSVNPKNVFD